jgi:hypothetical protein
VVTHQWAHVRRLIAPQLKHSLRTASLELSLERSKHSVEIVAKDEDIRKLQVNQCLLQNESSDLHEQLEAEQARADGLDLELSEALSKLDEQIAAAELAQNQIRTQAREVANLKVRCLKPRSCPFADTP